MPLWKCEPTWSTWGTNTDTQRNQRTETSSAANSTKRLLKSETDCRNTVTRGQTRSSPKLWHLFVHSLTCRGRFWHYLRVRKRKRAATFVPTITIMSNTVRYLTGPNTDHVTLSGPFIMRVCGDKFNKNRTGESDESKHSFKLSALLFSQLFQ